MLIHPPEIVILDIAMPGFDGYEFVQRVREHHELGGTMLVALTASGRRENQIRAVNAGFDVHLTKPIDMTAIEALLLKLPPHGSVLPTRSAVASRAEVRLK